MIDALSVVEARFSKDGISLDGFENFAGDFALVLHEYSSEPHRLRSGRGEPSLDLGDQILEVRRLGEVVVQVILDGANGGLQAGMTGDDYVLAGWRLEAESG